MKIITVKLSDELIQILKTIFAGCDLKYFDSNGDEYLLYLLRHMARLRGSDLSVHIYENHYTAKSAGFEQELAEIVRLTAISVHNIIAHRNLGQDQSSIEVD